MIYNISREREALELEFAFRYEALKARWKTILSMNGLNNGENETATGKVSAHPRVLYMYLYHSGYYKHKCSSMCIVLYFFQLIFK